MRQPSKHLDRCRVTKALEARDVETFILFKVGE